MSEYFPSAESVIWHDGEKLVAHATAGNGRAVCGLEIPVRGTKGYSRMPLSLTSKASCGACLMELAGDETVPPLAP